MRDAADMPELEKDQAALGVYGVDHTAPSLDLRLRIDAGNAGIATAGHHDGRGFRNQQTARRGALRIVFGVERSRRETQSFRPHSCQWRHHDTMLEPVRADLKRRKQTRKVHGVPPANTSGIILAAICDQKFVTATGRPARRLYKNISHAPPDRTTKNLIES